MAELIESQRQWNTLRMCHDIDIEMVDWFKYNAIYVGLQVDLENVIIHAIARTCIERHKHCNTFNWITVALNGICDYSRRNVYTFASKKKVNCQSLINPYAVQNIFHIVNIKAI